MEIKNLLTNPVETLSAEDLSHLQLVIADELEHRRLCAKETAWNEVVEAIKNYCSALEASNIIPTKRNIISMMIIISLLLVKFFSEY